VCRVDLSKFVPPVGAVNQTPHVNALRASQVALSDRISQVDEVTVCSSSGTHFRKNLRPDEPLAETWFINLPFKADKCSLDALKRRLMFGDFFQYALRLG